MLCHWKCYYCCHWSTWGSSCLKCRGAKICWNWAFSLPIFNVCEVIYQGVIWNYLSLQLRQLLLNLNKLLLEFVIIVHAIDALFVDISLNLNYCLLNFPHLSSKKPSGFLNIAFKVFHLLHNPNFLDFGRLARILHASVIVVLTKTKFSRFKKTRWGNRYEHLPCL